MVADMVLDCLTVRQYWRLCQDAALPCWMWQLGVVFLILPTFIATLVFSICLVLCDKTYTIETDFDSAIYFGPLYVLCSPFLAISASSQAAFCEDQVETSGDLSSSSCIKLPEIIGEALPQVK